MLTAYNNNAAPVEWLIAEQRNRWGNKNTHTHTRKANETRENGKKHMEPMIKLSNFPIKAANWAAKPLNFIVIFRSRPKVSSIKSIHMTTNFESFIGQITTAYEPIWRSHAILKSLLGLFDCVNWQLDACVVFQRQNHRLCRQCKHQLYNLNVHLQIVTFYRQTKQQTVARANGFRMFRFRYLLLHRWFGFSSAKW